MKIAVLLGLTMMVLPGEQLVQPPSMAKREIRKPEIPFLGKQLDLYGDGKFTLYVPPDWQPSGNLALTVHFHGAAWFAIQEHLRRGLNEPLLAIYAGEGSSVYQRAFQDPDSWSIVLSHVMSELKTPPGTRISRIDITSFSAGYGAVRELLKQELPEKHIRRIILADSMYASFTSPEDKTPLKSQIDPYLNFARAAIKGEKSFVITYSQVPTDTYANSAACGRELVKLLALTLTPRSTTAIQYPDYQLLETLDKGGLHIWGYTGTDAQAHMTHPRHIADIWRALWKD